MFQPSLFLIAVVASAISFVAVNAQQNPNCESFQPIIACQSVDGTPCKELKRRGPAKGKCEEEIVIKVKIRNSSTDFAGTAKTQEVTFTGPGFTNTEDQALAYDYNVNGDEALRIPKNGELVREYTKTVNLCKNKFNINFKARFIVNDGTGSFCFMNRMKGFEPIPFCAIENKITCKLSTGELCHEESECGTKTVRYEYQFCNINGEADIQAWGTGIEAKIGKNTLDTTDAKGIVKAGKCSIPIVKKIWKDTCTDYLPTASLKVKATPTSGRIQNCYAYQFENPWEEDGGDDKDDEKDKDKDKDEDKDKDKDKDDEKDKDKDKDKKDNKDKHEETDYRRNMRGVRQ